MIFKVFQLTRAVDTVCTNEQPEKVCTEKSTSREYTEDVGRHSAVDGRSIPHDRCESEWIHCPVREIYNASLLDVLRGNFRTMNLRGPQ